MEADLHPSGSQSASVCGHVLHVVPTALGRGAQVFARSLADELGGAQAGHAVLRLFDGPDDVAVDHALGVPGGVAAAAGFRPAAAARLAAFLRHARPSVVVAHGGDAFKYLAATSAAPIAYYAIGTLPGAARHGPRRQLWRALVRRAAVVAAVSDDVADECQAVLGVPAAAMVVVPNGRDPERFRPADRRTWGPLAAFRPARLLFAGHLVAGKRPDRFVALVAALRRRGLPVEARLVGDGPMADHLAAAAAAAGVELLGHRPDMPEMLRWADLLVFPSAPDGEGMPGVLVEAGLSGLPVVATAVPGVSTVVADGATGLIVPVDDADALLAATTALVVDVSRRRRLGAAARRRCAEQFSMAAAARRWERLLRELVGGGQTAARGSMVTGATRSGARRQQGAPARSARPGPTPGGRVG